MFDGSIIRSFITLGLAVGGIGIVLLLLRKFTSKLRKSPRPGINLNIISKVSLQPKTNLYIVQAGNKTLLLGASEKSISTLAELAAPRTAAGELSEVNQMIKKINGNHAIANQSAALAENKSLSFKSFLKSTLFKS